jgi:hypothetical protein
VIEAPLFRLLATINAGVIAGWSTFVDNTLMSGAVLHNFAAKRRRERGAVFRRLHVATARRRHLCAVFS